MAQALVKSDEQKKCVSAEVSRLAGKFKVWPIFAALAITLSFADPLDAREPGQQTSKRPITVGDAIGMTRLGLPEAVLNAPVTDGFAQFSPNGRRFIIVLKRGNLHKNTNDYSLLLYRTAEAFRSPRPETLLVLSTSSNRQAIHSVKWLDDNDTLMFIGERDGASPQVYKFSMGTRRLTAMTQHDSAVVAYDASADGRTILFEADPDTKELGSSKSVAEQAVVETHDIMDVLLGPSRKFRPTTTQGEELFLERNGEAEMHVRIPGVVYAELLPPSVSAGGQYGLVGVFVRDIPSRWSQYKERWLQDAINVPRAKGEVALTVAQYMLVNTATGELRPLLNAPVSWRNMGVAWAPDGKSVAVSGSFLPLEGEMRRAEREFRESHTSVVEVNPGEDSFVKVTDQDLEVKRWDRASGRLVFGQDSTGRNVEFQKTAGSWRAASSLGKDKERELQVSVREDINTPPKIYVSSAVTVKTSLLLDLNPQFSALDFGRVEAITWKATDGHEVSGGLFFPPGYQSGKRYPLVIQTHGFFPAKFYMDGPWSGAFAARPLAAREIMVLQAGYSTNGSEAEFENTPQEGPRQMSVYEGAIDFLDARGLIDRNDVGVIGFSRTVYTVAYTLTHSHYRFAAATLADGITGSYCDYLLFPYLSNMPLLNGGLPFGASLAVWLKNAPNFQLDKVKTPVRIEAYGPASALGLWEWFSGLTLLQKPVELIYLPGGQHLLTRPSDRLISQQGTVDWFCFWLKNEERGESPEESQRYVRWRALKKLEAVSPSDAKSN